MNNKFKNFFRNGWFSTITMVIIVFAVIVLLVGLHFLGAITNPPVTSVAALVPKTLTVIKAQATSTTGFQHVIIVVQENRTPDNLFQGLCNASGTGCGPYNISQGPWPHKGLPPVWPQKVSLVTSYDMGHGHSGFLRQYDKGLLDGTSGCGPTLNCPTNPVDSYVDPAEVQPYITLAQQFGFANYMFQTNQGPSAPAHQYLFGGTSAPTAAADALNTFASGNDNMSGGCLSASGTLVRLIVNGVESASSTAYPCFERPTLADFGLTWRYYANGPKTFWTAPTMIQHICQPSADLTKCTGPQWANMSFNPANVLTDIASGTLQQVSWVIPKGQNSDHAYGNKGGGPSWVASIVNSVRNSPIYWQNTAIIVTWDDWGGWFDHEKPTLNKNGYEDGFRVPLLFISAYTPAGTVDNGRHDFGSIIRFVEQNFGVGNLGFADNRCDPSWTDCSLDNLSGFYNFSQQPRAGGQVPSKLSANYFLNDKSAGTDPDNE